MESPEFDEDGLSDSRTFEATEVRMIDLHFPYDPEESPLTILYEYDFGDNWRHLLRLERVAREESAKYPRCSPPHAQDLRRRWWAFRLCQLPRGLARPRP